MDDEAPHLFAVGIAAGKVEIDLLIFRTPAAKTGDSFVGGLARDMALHQPNRIIRQHPHVGVGRDEAQKPTLILLDQKPVRMARPLLQPIAAFFLVW